jgi:hypothetical protein
MSWKGNKGRWGHVKRVKHDGNSFRSGFEKDTWKSIKRTLGRLGLPRPEKVLGYESEYLPYVLKKKWYIPDFVLVKKDDTKMFIEAKGYFDADARAKMAAVIKYNEFIDVRMVFMNNHKVGKVWRCSDWCESKGIPYAFETVPEERLREVKYADNKKG